MQVDQTRSNATNNPASVPDDRRLKLHEETRAPYTHTSSEICLYYYLHKHTGFLHQFQSRPVIDSENSASKPGVESSFPSHLASQPTDGRNQHKKRKTMHLDRTTMTQTRTSTHSMLYTDITTRLVCCWCWIACLSREFESNRNQTVRFRFPRLELVDKTCTIDLYALDYQTFILPRIRTLHMC